MCSLPSRVVSRSRAAESLVVLGVLTVLVSSSVGSAQAAVAGALERAEQQQAALVQAAGDVDRSLAAVTGEAAPVRDPALPATPAVQVARRFVDASAPDLPSPLWLLLPAAALVRPPRRRRPVFVRRRGLPVGLRARCGAVDPRGTVLLPVALR